LRNIGNHARHTAILDGTDFDTQAVAIAFYAANEMAMFIAYRKGDQHLAVGQIHHYVDAWQGFVGGTLHAACEAGLSRCSAI